MHVLIEKGKVENIDPEGAFFERAIGRALLSRWKASIETTPSQRLEKGTSQDGA
jgi:hypothetical protein